MKNSSEDRGRSRWRSALPAHASRQRRTGQGRLCRRSPIRPSTSPDASGKWGGWEVEIHRRDLRRGQARLRASRPIAWDGLIPALTTKKIDVIIELDVDHRRAHEDDRLLRQVLQHADRRSSAPRTQTFDATPEGLDGQDHRRAGLDRPCGLRQEALRPTAAEIKEYQTQDEANQDLAAGRIDAIQADSIALDAFLQVRAGQGLLRPQGQCRRRPRDPRPRRRRRPAQGRRPRSRTSSTPPSRRSATTASMTRSPRSISTSTSTAAELPSRASLSPRGRRRAVNDLRAGEPSRFRNGTRPSSGTLESLLTPSAAGQRCSTCWRSVRPAGAAVCCAGCINSIMIAVGAYALGMLIGIGGAFGKLYGGPIAARPARGLHDPGARRARTGADPAALFCRHRPDQPPARARSATQRDRHQRAGRRHLRARRRAGRLRDRGPARRDPGRSRRARSRPRAPTACRRC